MTFATETEAKAVGKVSTGVPEACSCTPPLAGNRSANSAPFTPTSTAPAANSALAPWATTWMSLPVFENPKSPFSVTNPPNDASNPVATTAAMLASTFNGALTAPTVTRVSTASAVLL